MCRFTRGVVAATAVALATRVAGAADDVLGNILEERSAAAESLIDAGPGMNIDGVSSEPWDQMIAEVQGMNDNDLKFELRALYSPAQDAVIKNLFPSGSLEAMQEQLNQLLPVDEELSDVVQYLNRYALLMGKTITKYSEFFSIKVALGDPSLSGEDYKVTSSKLPLAAQAWLNANNMLVRFLEVGVRDIKDKWEQHAATEKRLQDVLKFLESLAPLYKAQQKLFRAAYKLAQLRYLEYPDKQADMSILINDSREKVAQTGFDDALEDIMEKTHQSRKLAKGSVESGMLPEDFLSLLPFPRDKQREQDDLPKEEI